MKQIKKLLYDILFFFLCAIGVIGTVFFILWVGSWTYYIFDTYFPWPDLNFSTKDLPKLTKTFLTIN